MSDASDASPSRRHVWLGVLTLVACASLWSLNGPLIKLLDERGTSAITVAFYRSLFGGLLFLLPAWRGRATLRAVSPAWPIGSVAAFTLMTACFVIATMRTAAANAIILQYTSPIWVFLLSPLLLGERLRRSDGLALLLAMAGVAVIFAGHSTGDIPALAIGLASGLGYGSLTVALRGLRRVAPTTVVGVNFIGSSLLLLPAVGIWGNFALDGHQFVMVLILSLVQMAVPYVMFSWALRHIEAHQAALILLLEALINPTLTFLVVGEHVPRATLLGGPLILASVIAWMLITWRWERGQGAEGSRGRARNEGT